MSPRCDTAERGLAALGELSQTLHRVHGDPKAEKKLMRHPISTLPEARSGKSHQILSSIQGDPTEILGIGGPETRVSYISNLHQISVSANYDMVGGVC
jgi:hypothetical protein